MDKQHLQRLIYAAVDETNATLPPDKQLQKQPDTLLYGMGSVLDSIDLVTFIVCCEQKIQDEMKQQITIASEKALSMHRSPFRTLGSLSDYCWELLTEETADV